MAREIDGGGHTHATNSSAQTLPPNAGINGKALLAWQLVSGPQADVKNNHP